MAAVLAPESSTGSPRTAAGTGRRRGFDSCLEACPPVAAVIHGRIPPWLRGSLLMNGPAIWDLPGKSYTHWFDGLALLHRLAFSDNGVRYHSRFLDTEDARLTRQHGRPELGGYGTAAKGGLLTRVLHLLNPLRTDNGCVVLSECDGQWLALTESERVTRFDPETLATLGELRWADKMKLPLMAAHPCVDAHGRWWNVGVQFGRQCEYLLVSADKSGVREVKARIPTKRPGYLHAFALAGDHAVIWECAWRAHPLRFLFAVESYARHFDWLPGEGSRLHTVRLADGEVKSWEAPPLFLFHAAQAYRQGSDTIVDLLLDEAPVVEDLAIARLRAGVPTEAVRSRHTRFVLSAGAVSAREEALPGRFELPQVHPAIAGTRAARYVWGATAHPGGAFFDRTVKLDHQSGRLIESGRDDAISLEPLFVPRPGAQAEDDGVLLVHTLADDDAGSRVLALDAATLDELAAVELPRVVPFGFHSAWRPA